MTSAAWDEGLWRLAQTAAKSGCFAIQSAEQAYVLMGIGSELGLPPLQALRALHVLHGRVALASDTMVAIVRRSGLCTRWDVTEQSATAVTVVTVRKGAPEMDSVRWTIEDAQRAGLVKRNALWQQYPQQMLYHRAAADLARRVYADVLVGCYAPDEIEAEPDAAAPPPEPLPSARSDPPAAAPAAASSGELGPPVPSVASESVSTGVSPGVQRWIAKLEGYDLARLLGADTKLVQTLAQLDSTTDALALLGAYTARVRALLEELDDASLETVTERFATLHDDLRASDAWAAVQAYVEARLQVAPSAEASA